MTKEQYETELALLLERKRNNTNEARELDGELLSLRNRYLFPTFDEVENENKPQSVEPTTDNPLAEQGSVKRD